MSLSSYTIHTLCTNASCTQQDAEILLAHVLSVDRSYIIAYPERILTNAQFTTFTNLVTRRTGNEPLAYLTGSKEFYRRNFQVTSDVLIPRPETELLVELALKKATAHIIASTKEPLIIADIGTGSGAIITTLTAELASAHTTHNCGFIATDTSTQALKIANANARTLDVDEQIAFINTDLLTPFLTSEPLTRMLRLGAHLLVCANLPYVDSEKKEALLARSESRGLAFEPTQALWADDGGLDLYERFLTQLAEIHKNAPKAHITTLCEIDPSQEKSFIHRARKHFPTTSATSHPDLTSRTRIIEIALER